MDWNEAFGELRELLSHETLDEEKTHRLWSLVFAHQREDLERFTDEWLPYLRTHDTYDVDRLFEENEYGELFLREGFEEVLPTQLTDAYSEVVLYLGWSMDLREALTTGQWAQLHAASQGASYLGLDVQETQEGRAYQNTKLVFGARVHAIDYASWNAVVDPKALEAALRHVHEELPPSCESFRSQPLQMLVVAHGALHNATLMRGIMTDEEFENDWEEIDAEALIEELATLPLKDEALRLFLQCMASHGDERAFEEALAYQPEGQELKHPLYWEDEELGLDQDWGEFFARLSREAPHPVIDRYMLWKMYVEARDTYGGEIDYWPGSVEYEFENLSSNEWDSTHTHQSFWGQRWFERKQLRWEPNLTPVLDKHLEVSLRARLEEQEIEQLEDFEPRWLLIYSYP